MIGYISQLVSIIIIIIINNSTQYKVENRHRKFHSIIKLSVIVTEDWRANGYGWYQNGRKSLPSSAPVVEKIHNFLLVEGVSAPVKSKKFSKMCTRLRHTHIQTQTRTRICICTHTNLNIYTDTDTHTEYTCKYRTVPSLHFKGVPLQ